ncbi:hypothetical protein KKD04_01965 [Patescibacteria group bacterium]|nr:hypothetical protein [Patescibacteria group bacterium]
MKILIASVDLGPSKSLARLASGLVDVGHKVLGSFFAIPPSGLLDWHPDVAITGLSSLETQHELAISASAIEESIPVAWFSDTYGVFNREKIGSLRPNMLFVSDELEKKEAEKNGYKNVIASGIPIWEDFADLSLFPSQEEARKKLGAGKKDKLILFCGMETELNRKFLNDVIQAIRNLNDPSLILLPRFHPADPNRESYSKILNKVRWIESKGFKKTDELVPAADLIISPYSTLGITGAFQRKRVIDYIPGYFMDLLEKVTKRRYWVPAETGATLGVYKQRDLVPSIAYLFTKKGYTELVEKQKEVYPVKKGGAIKKMIEAVENLVGK